MLFGFKIKMHKFSFRLVFIERKPAFYSLVLFFKVKELFRYHWCIGVYIGIYHSTLCLCRIHKNAFQLDVSLVKIVAKNICAQNPAIWQMDLTLAFSCWNEIELLEHRFHRWRTNWAQTIPVRGKEKFNFPSISSFFFGKNNDI